MGVPETTGDQTASDIEQEDRYSKEEEGGEEREGSEGGNDKERCGRRGELIVGDKQG